MFSGESISGRCVFLGIARIQNLCSYFLTNSGFASALKFALLLKFTIFLKFSLFKKILLYHASNLIVLEVDTWFHIALNTLAFLNWGLHLELKSESWTSENAKIGCCCCCCKHRLAIPLLSCGFCRDNIKGQLHETHSYFHDIHYFLRTLKHSQ